MGIIRTFPEQQSLLSKQFFVGLTGPFDPRMKNPV